MTRWRDRELDPRDVRIAHVLKDGIPAATLERVDGAVEFSYSAAYEVLTTTANVVDEIEAGAIAWDPQRRRDLTRTLRRRRRDLGT